MRSDSTEVRYCQSLTDGQFQREADISVMDSERLITRYSIKHVSVQYIIHVDEDSVIFSDQRLT